jgi:hypothetical protein
MLRLRKRTPAEIAAIAVGANESVLDADQNGKPFYKLTDGSVKYPILDPAQITPAAIGAEPSGARAYADQKIADVVGAAPQALDTLKEIGDQLSNDESAVGALTTTVAGKAAASHSHTPAAIGAAASAHSHAESEVTNLAGDLAGKAPTSHNHDASYATTSHTHTAAAVGAAPAAHTSATDPHGDRTYADGRFTSLIGAAPAALDTLVEIATQLSNDESAASALTTTVAGKAAVVHTHAESDITGLGSDLAGKASTSHNHDAAYAALGHAHTPSQVGLANVDNTSDANKPISTATQTALNAKAPVGFATLANGTLAMAFATNNTVKVTPTATGTFTTTVPPAGTQCTLIILTAGVASFTITFGTGFKSTATLATGTTAARVFVVSWISDGTNLYETSRTIAMAA